MMQRAAYALALLATFGCTDDGSDLSTSERALSIAGYQQSANHAGIGETYSPLGSLEELEHTNSFFLDFGTTKRTCASCHHPAGGWNTSATREMWEASDGKDPLFNFTHDIGVCPDSDISKPDRRRRAMALALERGLTRSAVTVSPTAEFEVISIQDPYDCSTVTTSKFFGYRKPNTINTIAQKASITWAPAPQPDMRAALKGVMIGGTKLHGATTYTLTDAEARSGVDFMMNVYFAQIEDERAGRLDADGARGGPVHLSEQEWHAGINHSSTGASTRKVFDIYDAWIGADANCKTQECARRALIAEGQEIFNFRKNANGGTCSTCHNSPNVGSRSVYQLFDIGTVDIPDPDLPRVTLRNKATGQVRIVSNLGRAAATGKWSDIGRMKVETLRGLAARAPYFTSGQAKTIKDLIDHYDVRFKFGYTNHERAALAAFLNAL